MKNFNKFQHLAATQLVTLALLTSCSKDEKTSEFPPINAPDIGLFDVASDSAHEDAPPFTEQPEVWTVLLAADAPTAIGWTADDLQSYLSAMGLQASQQQASGPISCEPGHGRVVLMGDGLGETTFAMAEPTDQSFRIRETRCKNGVLVELHGGGLLGRQYAAYEWLHYLGVRFFHPEQEFVPPSPRWHDKVLERELTPAFRYRSASAHLTHPLEIGDALILNDPEYAGDARRYVDWQIKNLASVGHEGLFGGESTEHGLVRGLPRQAGFELHNQQQGQAGLINPDDERTEEVQMAEAIDALMGDEPARHPKIVDFTFNPSEFTEIDDRDAVRQLSFIADYFAEHYPDTIVTTINHTTAGPPTEHYKVRYYDLSKFAPSNLGVRVHTVMFYDLFRPAPVYGNTDFNHLFDFMEEEHEKRRIWFFPEAAWWLTFDIAIPMYLPITIEARHRDIQGIAHMLAGKLDGHRTFGTGHEWGYWQNEYCPFRMTVDLDYSYANCLEDIAWPSGPAAPELLAVLEDAISFQERDLIYGEIIAYLVGSDPETEIAASVGITFHPLPPSPREILRWSLEQVEAWESTILPALMGMDTDYTELNRRLRAVRSQVPAAGLPWFAEILDGLEATGLRARHAHQAFGAVVAFRRYQLTFDTEAELLTRQLLDAAEATTTQVIRVVRRRELAYRYKPLDRAIAGGEHGTEDDNWTVYRYRYLNRTHHGYYYKRTNDLVREALEGAAVAVDLPNVLVGPDQPMALTITDATLIDPIVDFGDGTIAPGTTFSHLYTTPASYLIQVTATGDDEPFEFSTRAARVQTRYTTAFSGRITAPSGTSLIEPAMPAISLGFLDDATIALGFSAEENGYVRPGYWTPVPATPGTVLETAPSRIVIPIVNRAQAEAMTSIVVEQGVIRLDAAPPTKLHLTGNLSTSAVISALVAIGGFNETGARALVAQTLGFTPDTLPNYVPFEAEYAIQPQAQD
ncbi:MAG: PKD domain-containing protein [Bradymonadaceae bacterium]|nr:PKD domain-containing protein [Lujinxingiaceae bacterium]